MAEPERLQRAAVGLLQRAQGGLEVARGLRHPALEQRLVLAALDEQRPVLQRALGGDEELLHVDGLEDEVVGAVLEALHRGLDVAHAGEDEEGRVGIDARAPGWRNSTPFMAGMCTSVTVSGGRSAPRRAPAPPRRWRPGGSRSPRRSKNSDSTRRIWRSSSTMSTRRAGRSELTSSAPACAR